MERNKKILIILKLHFLFCVVSASKGAMMLDPTCYCLNSILTQVIDPKLSSNIISRSATLRLSIIVVRALPLFERRRCSSFDRASVDRASVDRASVDCGSVVVPLHKIIYSRIIHATRLVLTKTLHSR